MSKNQFMNDVGDYIASIAPNYSPSTLAEKERKLRMYARIFYGLYSGGKVSSSAPAKLTAKDVSEFVTYRRSQGVSDATIAKDLSLMGMLLKWKGNTAMDVYRAMYGREKPRAYNGRKPPLDDEVVERVYALARSTSDWTLMEGCTAIVLGCACGLRPQEARKLYVDDVVLDGNRSMIAVEHVKGEGKWGRRRYAIVADGAEDILGKYIRMRSEKLAAFGVESRAMFPPLRGKGEFVTQQSFGRMKDAVADLLGEEFALRDGRRAYGQRLLNRDIPIEKVSYSMGHDSVLTTQRYYASFEEGKILREIQEQLLGPYDGAGAGAPEEARRAFRRGATAWARTPSVWVGQIPTRGPVISRLDSHISYSEGLTERSI